MSAELYGSVGGVNRKVKKLYANVNGVTREIKRVYANVNGVVRKVYSGEVEALFSKFFANTPYSSDEDRIINVTDTTYAGISFNNMSTNIEDYSSAVLVYYIKAPYAIAQGERMITFSGNPKLYSSYADAGEANLHVLARNEYNVIGINYTPPYTFYAPADIQAGDTVFLMFKSYLVCELHGRQITSYAKFPWSGITFGPSNEKIVLKTT